MSSRARISLAAGLLAVAALAVYAGSFSGPLVLDDTASIADNPSLRHLWPLSIPLSPPAREGITVSGRPILNLSLALNWAVGGAEVTGYHVVNLAIHILAGLVLFGLVRRTLDRGRAGRPGPPVGPGGPGGSALPAFAAALLWLVHPLQTESVTYIVQRAESLMGLFYLLTLYCFVRYAEPDGPNGRLGEASLPSASPPGVGTPLRGVRANPWPILSVLACLLGMATKEVMVSAPFIVLLYDRTFISGSFAQAWRRRRPYYAALAATWFWLAWLAVRTGNRGGTSGLGIGVGFGRYLLTQFPAILRYLRLSVWPRPLVFDYGAQWVAHPWSAAPAAVIVLGLAAASLGLAVRPIQGPEDANRAALGFLGVFFFALLAPASLVPGDRQTAAEHRMYLALAPIVILATLTLYRALSRRPSTSGRRREAPPAELPSPGDRRPPAIAFSLVVTALAVGLGFATAARNRDYRSVLALYQDTIEKVPDNGYAQNNYGIALAAAGRLPDALAHYREAVRLDPTSAEARNDLASALSDLGQPEEAAEQYEEALRLKPGFAQAYSNLGRLLARTGHGAEATACFQHALELNPNLAEAHLNLGNMYAGAERPADAEQEYKTALRLSPEYAEAENNFGNLLFRSGRLDEARRHVEAALRIKPAYSGAHLNLANIIASGGRLRDSLAEYRRALELDPKNADAHYDLAMVLRALGRNDEAAAEMAKVVR